METKSDEFLNGSYVVLFNTSTDKSVLKVGSRQFPSIDEPYARYLGNIGEDYFVIGANYFLSRHTVNPVYKNSNRIIQNKSFGIYYILNDKIVYVEPDRLTSYDTNGVIVKTIDMRTENETCHAGMLYDNYLKLDTPDKIIVIDSDLNIVNSIPFVYNIHSLDDKFITYTDGLINVYTVPSLTKKYSVKADFEFDYLFVYALKDDTVIVTSINDKYIYKVRETSVKVEIDAQTLGGGQQKSFHINEDYIAISHVDTLIMNIQLEKLFVLRSFISRGLVDNLICSRDNTIYNIDSRQYVTYRYVDVPNVCDVHMHKRVTHDQPVVDRLRKLLDTDILNHDVVGIVLSYL